MADLISSAKAFQRVINRAKASVKPRTFGWYPYGSLSSVIHQFGPLMDDTDGRRILDASRALPLLDVGCGDGDIAFLFESLGYRVVAVDYELTNFNQMNGVRALKTELNSSLTLQSADLDGRFKIDGSPFGMAILSGVLYHLKNPFYLLEYVARIAQYCLLTTRIAQLTPGGIDMSREPLAYLVDLTEMNNDATNYWILSAPALRRLLTRAGWTVCRFTSTGCTDGSSVNNRDERAVCLLRSRLTMGSRVQLLSGWHELEKGVYRWTEPAFSACLSEPILRGAVIRFRFTLAHDFAEGPVTIQSTVNGIALVTLSYQTAGHHTYSSRIPESLEGSGQVLIQFRINRPVRATNDPRILGLLVSFWRDGTPITDDNLPLDISY